MTIFKILLIILVSAPVIGFALYFYAQMLDFIKVRNKAEEDQLKAESRVRPERQAAESRGKKKKAGQKSSKGRKPKSSEKPAKSKKAKGSAAKKEKRQ